MKTNISGLIIFICGIFLIYDLQAQVQTYRPAEDSYVRVTGTSTLHDWELVSEDISSELRFGTGDDGQPEKIESVSFTLNKKTLKSDKSGLDRRAYEALDANRHPEIVFHANGSGRLEKNGDKYQINSTGELTLAGTKREINVQATCINGEDKKLVCSGSQKLKMSDFDIDPPVMMLGALRTGDEVTVSYSIVFVQ
ncbi:MAG: YceI family protein [Bacteroidales bacterium]